MSDNGNVLWAVQLYTDVQRKERAVEKAEKKLNEWLRCLNQDELTLYASKTLALDVQRDDAEARRLGILLR